MTMVFKSFKIKMFKGGVLLPISLYVLMSLILSSCVQIPAINDKDKARAESGTQVEPKVKANIKPELTNIELNTKVASQQNSVITVDIVMAARDGRIQTLEQGLLQGQKTLNQRDMLGNTPLIAAAANGHEDVVVFLIENHVDVDVQAHNGSDALMMASQFDHERIVNHLLLAGIDVQQRDDKGENALFYAVRKGHVSIVYNLLDHDADPNIVSKTRNHVYRGYTPLMYAASQKPSPEWLEIVSILLDYGAEPNASQMTGETAWSLAQKKQHHAIMAKLKEAGAISDEGHDELLEAGVKSDEEHDALLIASDKLLDSVLDRPLAINDLEKLQNTLCNCDEPGKPASQGDTPLISAIRRGQAETVDHLLNNSENFNLPNTQFETPGLVAARTGDADIMGMLIMNGLNPDEAFNSSYNDYYIARILRQEKARALLIEATLNDHAETVRVIVEKGGNVNVADQDGRTALSWAAEKGYVTTAKMLIDYNSDVEKRDNLGRTPLIYAAIYGQEKIVTLLLASSAEVNATDGEKKSSGVAVKIAGESALIHAARSGYIDVVRLLLEHGAEKRLVLATGETAEMVAKKNGHTAVAKLIASYR